MDPGSAPAVNKTMTIKLERLGEKYDVVSNIFWNKMTEKGVGDLFSAIF